MESYVDRHNSPLRDAKPSCHHCGFEPLSAGRVTHEGTGCVVRLQPRLPPMHFSQLGGQANKSLRSSNFAQPSLHSTSKGGPEPDSACPSLLTILILSFTDILFLLFSRLLLPSRCRHTFTFRDLFAVYSHLPVMRLSTIATIVAGVASTSVSAIPTISIKGAKFFTSDGAQFYIKGKQGSPRTLLIPPDRNRSGVAYQLVPDDPLLNGTQCALDASLMKTLGANTIRVYHVDGTADHSDCMNTFADAGIYVFVDMDTFDTQIEQNDPHWNQTQLSAFEVIMDEFQKYDNTAGLLVGNEVLTMPNGSVAAPFVKAAARDTKAYRDSKGYREIPIGYSAADIASLRPMLQNYLACGTNSSENVDFFSLNAYEWCGDSSYQISGYSQLTANATDYPIPIFFSETGCNVPEPRTFDDQSAIFGPEMNGIWSGAIVYEWIEEANNYGLISYGPYVDPTASGAPEDGYTRSGTPIPISPDFSNLSNQWKTLNPTGISENDYTPSLTPPPCPAYTSGVWDVNGNVALPTLGQTFNAQVESSITAGTAATGTGSASAAKTGAASPARDVKGIKLRLAGVVLAFFWWM